MKRILSIAAALAAALLAGGQARADYSYMTSLTPASAMLNNAGHSPTTVQLNDASGTGFTGSFNASIALIHVASTPTTNPSQTGDVTLTDTITLSDGMGHTGNLVVAGTIHFLANHPTTFALDAGASVFSVLVGSTTFSMVAGDVTFSVPTVNGTDGSLGTFITVTTVPEPASMAMLGVGGLLLAAPRLRRIARARFARD